MNRLPVSILAAFAAVCWAWDLSAQEAELSAPATNSASRTEFTIHAGAGRIEYREDVSVVPVDSDWESEYTYLAGSVETDLGGTLIGGLNLLLFSSSEDTEEWSDPDGLRQRNDLQVSGFEGLMFLGLNLGAPETLRIRPTAGLGVRSQVFERSRFVQVQDGDRRLLDTGSVDETFVVLHARAGLEAVLRMTDRVQLRADAAWSPVLYTEADNDALGSVDGDGGDILEAGLAVACRVSDRAWLGAGITWERQELEGDVRRSGPSGSEGEVVELEWPDNTLERFAAEVFCEFAL